MHFMNHSTGRRGPGRPGHQVGPFVSNVLVIGDGRTFCAALIAFDETMIMPWAAAHDLGGRSYADVISSPRVHELIDGFVQRVNGDLQRWQNKFSVLPRDLDVEHGERAPWAGRVLERHGSGRRPSTNLAGDRGRA
jgi:long-subunit acyl-CoA synthetase (AMP-forming)